MTNEPVTRPVFDAEIARINERFDSLEQSLTAKIVASEERQTGRLEEQIAASEERLTSRFDERLTTAIAASEERLTSRFDERLTTTIAASEERLIKRIAASENRLSWEIAHAINAGIEHITTRLRPLADKDRQLETFMARLRRDFEEHRDDDSRHRS